MRWFKYFRDRRSGLGSALRDRLFDAIEARDERALDALCQSNRARILEEFNSWVRAPEGVRDDPNARNRFAQGLVAVAGWFERNGFPQLRAALEGEGRGTNPIDLWLNSFREADTLKVQSRFHDAGNVLEKLAHQMQQYRGSAVERYLPMVQGSLGECLFRVGELDRAAEVTRDALDGCLRNGDIEGIITYTGNMAEICGKQEGGEQNFWLILSTNAMIQAGQKERAADVRRLHGLEPTEGLIQTGPLPDRPKRSS